MDFAAEEGFPTGDGIDLLTQCLLPTGDLREHCSEGRFAILPAKARGKRDEAVELYARALAIFERVLDPSHPKVVTCRENDARLKSKNHPPAIASKDFAAVGQS